MMVKLWRRFGIGAIALAMVACSQPTELSTSPADAPSAEETEAAAEPSEVAASSGEAGGAETPSELAEIEAAVLEQINAYRQEQGLKPLATNDAIRGQSREHSSAMAQGTAPVSHQGFDGRVEAIAKSVAYRSAAENVAYNEGYADPGEQAVQGWIESPGHLENIRGDYDLTGVGVARDGQAYYFTQIFIQTP